MASSAEQHLAGMLALCSAKGAVAISNRLMLDQSVTVILVGLALGFVVGTLIPQRFYDRLGSRLQMFVKLVPLFIITYGVASLIGNGGVAAYGKEIAYTMNAVAIVVSALLIWVAFKAKRIGSLQIVSGS